MRSAYGTTSRSGPATTSVENILSPRELRWPPDDWRRSHVVRGRRTSSGQYAVLDMRRSGSGPPHTAVAAAPRPARVRWRRTDIKGERPVEADSVIVGLGDNLPRHTDKSINERPPDSVAT